MAVEKKKLVGRHKRLAFMDVEGTGTTFIRMTGFTALSEGKEAKEYNRQYVDEATERNDVVGYATSVEYEFDRYTNDKVCEKICTITDDELVGTEAQVDIVTVDVFTADDKKRAIARKRTWSVIPDTSGDGTDALIYSGSFAAASEITKGSGTGESRGRLAIYRSVQSRFRITRKRLNCLRTLGLLIRWTIKGTESII